MFKHQTTAIRMQLQYIEFLRESIKMLLRMDQKWTRHQIKKSIPFTKSCSWKNCGWCKNWNCGFNVLQSLVFVFHVTCSLDISEVFLLKIHSGAKRVPRLLYENHSPLPSLPPYSSFCLQAIVSLHWHHPLPLSSKCICICIFVRRVFIWFAPYSSVKFKL